MPLILRYATSEGPQSGILHGDDIHRITDSTIFDPFLPITGTPVMALSEATLLPPVQPGKIVCIGRNYAAHAAEHHAEVPAEPMIFLKPPSALIGHRAAIELPPNAGRVDHEAELAVVIGQHTRDVSRENALDVVLGYTCANDVSAREYQQKDGQWGRAKGFDTFCPLGPWINTDLDPADLAIRARVNGESKQDSRTSQMVFDVPALIAFISHIMTLEPGDVILTGTPAGVSSLQPGDTVQVEIEGLGVLENPVRLRQ